MRLFLLSSLLSFLFLHNSWCQGIPQGVIIIHVAPQNAIIYMDSIKQKNHDQIRVAEGQHVLKIWAPGRQFVNETVSIIKDSILVYVMTLPYTNEYLEFKKKKSNYLLVRIVPPALTVIGTVVLMTSYSHSKKLMDQYDAEAKQSEQSFYSGFSVATLEQSKANFNQSKESYEKSRRRANASIVAEVILIPVGIGTSLYFFLRSKKPKYQETPLLTRVNSNLFLTDNGGAEVSLSYKF
jgi:hypothetical protein